MLLAVLNILLFQCGDRFKTPEYDADSDSDV